MSIEAARYAVARGIKVLNEHVPGWFDRVRNSGTNIDMLTSEYDPVGIATHGCYVNGQLISNSAEFCRVLGVSGTEIGLIEYSKHFIEYEYLARAWAEVFKNPSPPRGYRPATITYVHVPETFFDVVRAILGRYRSAA